MAYWDKDREFVTNLLNEGMIQGKYFWRGLINLLLKKMSEADWSGGLRLPWKKAVTTAGNCVVAARRIIKQYKNTVVITLTIMQ